MNEKYVYFRTVATLTSDDGIADSCLYPLSSFRGGYTNSATTVLLRFKSMVKSTSAAATDFISITTSSGDSGAVLEAITEEFSTGENYFIVIGDDVSGIEDYLVPQITAVGGITIG